MDQGQPHKESRKPTWTDLAVPETVRPAAPTRPLSPDDPDALVPAADPIVQAAYSRTGALPVRPLMNRGDRDADALVIQKSAKQTRVLNFRVEGIAWRAGFAPEIAQTPLRQYVASPQPPQHEQRVGNGFVLKPVEPELEVVLRDMVPAKLLGLGEEMFGRVRELAGVYLYFVSPTGAGATIGMLAWYLPAIGGRAHVLYLQTDLAKAEPRILDEMHQTFRASLAARAQKGEPTRPLDFWQELQIASTQVETTLRNSALGRNSVQVRERMHAARQQAESRLYSGMTGGMSNLGELIVYLVTEWPQRLLANAVRWGSQRLIGAIQRVDAIAARRTRDDDFL